MIDLIFGILFTGLMACWALAGIMAMRRAKPEPEWHLEAERAHPGPRAMLDRYKDTDCRTDFDVQQEARRLHRQTVSRALKAKWN